MELVVTRHRLRLSHAAVPVGFSLRKLPSTHGTFLLGGGRILFFMTMMNILLKHLFSYFLLLKGFRISRFVLNFQG